MAEAIVCHYYNNIHIQLNSDMTFFPRGANVREAKKANATCLITFGGSQSLSGETEVQLHVNVIFDNPTV